MFYLARRTKAQNSPQEPCSQLIKRLSPAPLSKHTFPHFSLQDTVRGVEDKAVSSHAGEEEALNFTGRLCIKGGAMF